jgi:hypothetical protein
MFYVTPYKDQSLLHTCTVRDPYYGSKMTSSLSDNCCVIRYVTRLTRKN